MVLAQDGRGQVRGQTPAGLHRDVHHARFAEQVPDRPGGILVVGDNHDFGEGVVDLGAPDGLPEGGQGRRPDIYDSD